MVIGIQIPSSLKRWLQTKYFRAAWSACILKAGCLQNGYITKEKCKAPLPWAPAARRVEGPVGTDVSCKSLPPSHAWFIQYSNSLGTYPQAFIRAPPPFSFNSCKKIGLLSQSSKGRSGFDCALIPRLRAKEHSPAFCKCFLNPGALGECPCLDEPGIRWARECNPLGFDQHCLGSTPKTFPWTWLCKKLLQLETFIKLFWMTLAIIWFW